MRHRAFILIGLFLFESSCGQQKFRPAKPVFTSDALTRVEVGRTYHYKFYAADSFGNPISYSAPVLPAGLNYSEANHSITGRPYGVGQYPITISAANEKETTKQQFILTVYDTATVNILCLGNSITNGTNKYNSYRRDLWQSLNKEGYNFDLIGSWSKHHMGGEVPNPDFDTDHEGHSGWRFDDVFHPPGWDSLRGNIDQWLMTYKPDIVLLELGTNDVFQCRSVADMIRDLDKLVAVLRNKNKTVRIFVAQIPPLGAEWADKKLCGIEKTYREVIVALNAAIGLFAGKASSSQSPVIVVDQFSGIDPAKDMYDDIHPNDIGEKIMAGRWLDAIRPYLKKLK